jgi:pimeloyl-ACP methyl ester carboxylesterase
MVGGGDRLVSKEEAERFASLMPNARVISCEDFGHDMPQGPQLQQLLTSYNLD